MQISGFQVLPVSLGPGSDGEPVLHYLYFKKHGVSRHRVADSSDNQAAGSASASSVRSDDEVAVFVINLPHDTTLDNIKDLCETYGHVFMENFEYQGQHRGVIRFVDAGACKRFLAKIGKSKTVLEWSEYGPRGSEAYRARNLTRFPSESDLLGQADEYMEAYNELEQSQRLEAARAGRLVDEDGFTLVVGQNRKSLADIPRPSSSPKRKRKSLEKKDFYRFQHRERQKNEMNTLLQRYKDDKERVEDLKRKKMLKPY